MSTNLENLSVVADADLSFPFGGGQWEDEWSNNGSIGTPEGYSDQVRTWKRFDDAVLFDGIDPGDIRQGHAGDCYFLASCASLAESPDVIKSLFLNNGQLENGAIGVKFYHDGKPRAVWIDDHFPADGAGVALFAKPSTGNATELWMMALEKAYAKLHGRYENMGRGGFPVVALNDLTGYPTTSFYTHGVGKSAIWRHLKDGKSKTDIGTKTPAATATTNEMHATAPDAASKAPAAKERRIISASINSSPFLRFMLCGLARLLSGFFAFVSHSLYWLFSLTTYTKFAADLALFCWFWIKWPFVTCGAATGLTSLLGLLDNLLSLLTVGMVGGHAYSVLDVCDHGCTRLVKVKNPWGNKSEYRGWFSDKSYCWACRPGLAEAVKNAEAKEDDGSWWMSLGDFAMYFDRIDILHLDPSLSCLRVQGTMRHNVTYLAFTVKQACKLRVQLHQERRVCMDAHGLGAIDWGVSVCLQDAPDKPVLPVRPSLIERTLLCREDNPEAESGFRAQQQGIKFRLCTMGTPALSLDPGRYVVRVDHTGGGGDLPVNLTYAFYSDKGVNSFSVDGISAAANRV